MATIDFLAFGTAVGANVMSQPDYLAAVWRASGFQPGLAQSMQANKVWRQSAFFIAALAQYVSVQNGGVDVLDDGDQAALLAKLTSAIAIGAGLRPARLITSSVNTALTLADYRVGLNRTAGLAQMNINLPAVTDANIGQEWKIQDIVGNLQGFPAVIIPAAGTIAGAANFTMNVDKQTAAFAYYGTNLWGVEA